MSYEKTEEILAVVGSAERYVRVLMAMQLPIESILDVEHQAVLKARRTLSDLGFAGVHVPDTAVLLEEATDELLRQAVAVPLDDGDEVLDLEPATEEADRAASPARAIVPELQELAIDDLVSEPEDLELEEPDVEPLDLDESAELELGDLDEIPALDLGPDEEPELTEPALSLDDLEPLELDVSSDDLVELEPEEPLELDAEPLELEAEPLELEAEPLELDAEPLDLGAEPLDLDDEALDLSPEPELNLDEALGLGEDEGLIDFGEASADTLTSGDFEDFDGPQADGWDDEEATNVFGAEELAILQPPTPAAEDLDAFADDLGDMPSDDGVVIPKADPDEFEEESTLPKIALKKPKSVGGPQIAMGGPQIAMGGPKIAVAGPQVAAGPRVAVGAQVSLDDGENARAAARAGGLYGSNVPTIREKKEPKPKAAAIQLGVNATTGGTTTKVLGHEEEEEALEIGDPGDYGDDEYDDEYDDDDDAEGGFSVGVEEYEEEEEEWEEEEEEEELPPPPPMPVGPSSSEIDELLHRARAAQDAGNMDEAVLLYSDVLDGDPENVMAYVGRGRIHLDMGDYARAMSDFTIAEEEAPKNPEPQVAIGDMYFARKDYRKAIEHFDAALHMDADHAMAFCRRGISHYYRKNYKQALQDLNKAQKIDPDIPNIRTFITMAKKRAK